MFKFKEAKEDDVIKEGEGNLEAWRKIHIEFFKKYYPDFNDDYAGKKFNIEKGSIIAVGETEDVMIEKDIDDLTTVNSIIKIKGLSFVCF